jgi:hypothetical protein
MPKKGGAFSPYYIYALIDPRTWQIRYVGKTKDIDSRLKSHLCGIHSARTGQRKNDWLKELDRNGLKPVIIPIDYITSVDRYPIEKLEYSYDAEEMWYVALVLSGVPLTNYQFKNVPEFQERFYGRVMAICRLTRFLTGNVRELFFSIIREHRTSLRLDPSRLP